MSDPATFHTALANEIERVKAEHGYCVLWDCHSIKSVIPRLFEGTLPTLNLGTNSGQSCASSVEAAAVTAMAGQPLTQIANGRFKGGWITRHYGRPASQVHALQMEIALSAYLADEAPPWTFDAARAAMMAAPLMTVLPPMMATVPKVPL